MPLTFITHNGIQYPERRQMLTMIKQLTFKCKHPLAIYKCECGNQVTREIYSVRNESIASCGCYSQMVRTIKQTKYTHTIPKLHNAWTGMKSRCYNIKNVEYNRYGGSGVTVCDEWLNNYQSFLDWSLENGWRPGLQLDKDKLGNGKVYSPITCCYLTPRENTNNRRNTIFVRIDGIDQPLKPICEKEDLNYYSMQKRIKKGIDYQIAKFLYLNRQKHAA